MRKLGIVIAITAAATLGFAGYASAQSLRDVPEAGDAVCDGAEGFAGQAGQLEPVRQGFVDTGCTSGGDNPLCGVVGQLPADLAPLTGPLSEGLSCPTTTTTPDPDPDPGPDPTTPTGGGGAQVQGVQAANAAPDGSLPRTGGELFAAGGFVLTSLGVLIRRLFTR